MTDREIIEHLRAKYGEQIENIDKLPKSYWSGKCEDVKAIYLGCDPSNKHSKELPFAFAHKSNVKVFDAFIKFHENQLKAINLSWENVYAQNLCRNYFQKETSNNKIWKKVALEFWIEELKNELSIFPNNIPVILTSQYLLQVLGYNETSKYTAPDIYRGFVNTPIAATKNKLQRILIPVYRGRSPKLKKTYEMKNWEEYADKIKSYFE
jgi:hypothetical protein